MEMEPGTRNTARSDYAGEDKISSLFQPDTVLSEQYFENLRRKTYFEPEKRLMLAVLEDAIRCYQDNLHARKSKRRRLFEETEEWIVTGTDDYVFSFRHVCEALGLSPEYLRQGMLRWKQRNQNALAAMPQRPQSKLAV
jgi:hypothetical protein